MKRKFLLLTTAMLSIASLTGCTTSNAETITPTTVTTTSATGTTADAGVTPPTALSGSIIMVGSTSMEKFANALSEAFIEKNPDVTVQAEFIGSGAGIEAAVNGTADIGNSSRNLKEEEKEKGAVENIVAIDGIAVVLNPTSTITDLTKEQLSGIYNGTITNWSQAGGGNEAIVVIGREAGSGTRGAFEEILKLEDACRYSNELDSTGAVMAKVSATPGAIGYVSLDVVDDSVKAVSLEGVAANPDNIKSGSYFLSRPFVMATKGQISEQSNAVKAMFDYIFSEEGNSLVTSVGLIPVQ